MELSREQIDNLEKDIADLQSLLVQANREHSKQIIERELLILQKRKELVKDLFNCLFRIRWNQAHPRRSLQMLRKLSMGKRNLESSRRRS